MSELSERLDALKQKNDGKNEQELKDAYLERVAGGEMPEHAARELGKTSTWFRRRRSTNSMHYDHDFAERYEEIMHPEGEHRAALVQKLRSDLMAAASNGNIRAIEKGLMAYDPEFAFLRPVAFAGDFNVDKMMVVMKDIPTAAPRADARGAYREGVQAESAARR